MAFHPTRLAIPTIFALTLCFTLLAPLLAADPDPIPARLLPTPAKDTTYFLGPLRPDGTVDYIAALNQHLSQGITPDNNAAYALFAVIPPERLAIEDQGGIARLEAALGAPFPPARPIYRGIPSRDPDHPVGRHFYRAVEGPWTPAKVPVVADWLAANQQALDAVVQAVERDRAWWPLITDEPGVWFTSMLLPELGETRPIARGLTIRAHLALAHAKPDDALRDWIALQRLGRHTATNPILISRLVGYSVQNIADQLAVRILASPHLKPEHLHQMADHAAASHPVHPIADAIDSAERVMLLNSLIQAASGRVAVEDVLEAQGRFALRSPRFRIDPALRQINRRYDQLVEMTRLPTATAFALRLDQFIEELEAAQHPVTGMQGREGDAADRFSAWLGDGMAGGLVMVIDPAFASNLDANQQLALVQLAIALRLYHFEHDRYPATLDALTPKYIAELPVDRYDGRPLTYKPGPDGKTYLLYALGRNGQDDGGIHNPRDADLAVGDPMPAGW
ncbi:MAG: hypothetical protein AAGI68_04545 [Planctomycetota bacterium]